MKRSPLRRKTPLRSRPIDFIRPASFIDPEQYAAPFPDLLVRRDTQDGEGPRVRREGASASAVFTERTEPEGWRQAKIWKILLAHLDTFAVEFCGFFVHVTVKGVEHIFANDVGSVRDYAAKHWGAKRDPRTYVSGERHPRPKLDKEKVAAIRARCAAGESQMVVAAEIGVSNRTVSDVICGRTWKVAP